MDVVTRFVSASKQHPHSVAVRHLNRELSYLELDQQSDRLAEELMSIVIGAEDVVAVCMQRSVEFITSLLGILKARAAYLPLEPEFPPDRIRTLLDKSRAKLLLLHEPTAQMASLHEAHRQVDTYSCHPGSTPSKPAHVPAQRDLAYLIFTSGSTGDPKGVCVERASLANMVGSWITFFSLSAADRSPHLSSLGFDAAALEIWPSLCVGATIVIPDEATRRSPSRLVEWMKAERITLSFLPTPYMEIFMHLPWEQIGCIDSLRFLATGGDRLRIRPPHSLNCPVYNCYGPTECTVVATVGPVQPEPADAPPDIGRCLDFSRAYILDESGVKVPVGSIGEMYIGGKGVARGYFDSPDETAKRFMLDPFVKESGARMYATGDLCRLTERGAFEFIGRRDRQVKIRGHRIELGEVETNLIRISGVRQAAVRQINTGNDVALAAYVETSLSRDAVLNALKARLPAYMIPNCLHILPRLPLLPSGKIDRAQLQNFSEPEGYPSVSPNLDEWDVEGCFAYCLGVSRVPSGSNFFFLGGNSLSAMRLLALIYRKFGAAIPFDAFLSEPTVDGVLRILSKPERAKDRLTELRRRPEGQRHIPLSMQQELIWFQLSLQPKDTAYHSNALIYIRGQLNAEALLASLRKVVEKHDVFRTTIELIDGHPVQVVREDVAVSLPVLDARRAGKKAAHRLCHRLLRTTLNTPFDFASPPLARWMLVRTQDKEYVLLHLEHHLIHDGWSFNLFLNDLFACYRRNGAATGGDELQYADFVYTQKQWLSSSRAREQQQYWCSKLSRCPVTRMPPDRKSEARQRTSTRGAMIRESGATEYWQRIESGARKHAISTFSFMYAAFAILLARYLDQEDICVGSAFANRNWQGSERIVGMFVNTVALRLDVKCEIPVREVLREASRVVAEALGNQELPFTEVVARVNPLRQDGASPFFDIFFSFHDSPRPVIPASDIEVEIKPAIGNGGAKFGLSLVVIPPDKGSQGEFEFVWEYCSESFLRGTIRRFIRRFHVLLERLMEGSLDVPVRELDILLLDERRLLLEAWNQTEAACLSDSCLHQLFEQHVANNPQAVAVTFENQSLSYGELNRQANQLANYLIHLGVRPDDRIAICVERSLGTVVGLIAILKSAGAYIPLDPGYPRARLRQILDDAKPILLLADAAGREALGYDALAYFTVLDLDARGAPWAHWPATNPDPKVHGLTSRHLAYVIYTSGSTGMPKGVMVEHAQIVRLLEATKDLYQFNDHDVWCLFHSISFDFSVWELWGALSHGARLIVVPDDVVRSTSDFYDLICRFGVTILNQTPSAFRALIDAQTQVRLQHRLRYVIFGGEALEPFTLRPWYACHSDQSPQLVNMYGITEATVHTTFYILQSSDGSQSVSPIGRRLADVRIYLLDSQGKPVPLGAAGEIHIGGAGVARGYLNRPGLTAERFLPDPFSPVPGARMYRTGDVARYQPDGNLAFLGRNDQQVKIRGFRIEPGEIEVHLTSHAAVREAVVIAREDRPGEKRLVAYLTRSPGTEVSAEQLAEILRAHLTARVPKYMAPAAFVQLDSLPLTPNGKLDRKALPAPDDDAFVRDVFEPPQSSMERTLAGIWEQLLGISRISRHDNFFKLGGHSLLAVRLMARLRRLGLSTDVRTIFAAPDLATLAITLGSYQDVPVPRNAIPHESAVLTPAMLPLIELSQEDIDHIIARVPGGISNIQDLYALSPLQDGILFHHLLAKEGDPYLLMRQMAFPDRALLDRYLVALQQVVARHDILRSAFFWEQLSSPSQVVLRRAPLSVTEVTLDPGGGPAAEQLARRFDPRRHCIDLAKAPLLRSVIARDPGSERWLLVQLLHHLIGDHSTLEILDAEVRSLLAGQAYTLSEPQPFRNLVAQARLGLSPREHERFFCEMLADVDEPTVPFGLTDVHRDGSEVIEARRMLPEALNVQLRAHARRLGVSLASLCHLAWGQVIARTSGRTSVVFGTVLFGRMHAGDGGDRAMGLFINTLPLRLDLAEGGIEESVRRTHACLGELLRHEHASLALAQRCSGVRAPAPLFSALLNYRHQLLPATTAADRSEDPLREVQWLSGKERTNYPLTLSVEDFGQALGLTAHILSPLSPERICNYMQQALEQLVQALEHAPHAPVSHLDVLPPDERGLLLESWNLTDAPYPEHLCIHQLFEQQVDRTPEATALVYGQISLSYADLNAHANRLAYHLIALGVCPDDRIAICLERTPAMVIGLLAILKAGGAYVPLDPAYPLDRLMQTLTDAAPRILLCDQTGRRALRESALACVTIVDVDASQAAWAALPTSNPPPNALGLSSRHLAYIIYTSGSTGAPKGVAVEHRSACNYLHWAVLTYAPQHGSIVSTPLAFDATITSLYTPLLCGGTITLLSDGEELEALKSLMSQQRFRCLIKVTPTLLDFLGSRFTATERLSISNLFVVGGESLSPSTARLWLAPASPSRLINQYGPTETTVGCATHELSTDFDDTGVPIGRPIANTRIYLLDARGEPVPLGAVGEIYIGGAGVARGYLNRPELTAERFLPDPFSPHPGARMYKSGDLARYLPDGNLLFLGRNDQQVKIRGFRVEPGEIEADLRSHPAVREAVVIAREDSLGEKRLVAYLTCYADCDLCPEQLPQVLRSCLAAKLPAHMLPAAFVRVEALPLTPNGKLDRKALPAPEEEAFAHEAYEAPQGHVERTLASLWEALLGVSGISRHDNFFELGGHSLLAVRLISRLPRAFNVELPMAAVFAQPILCNLARTIGSARRRSPAQIAPPITPRDREDRIHLGCAKGAHDHR